MRIMALTGTPSTELLVKLGSEEVSLFLSRFPHMRPIAVRVWGFTQVAWRMHDAKKIGLEHWEHRKNPSLFDVD